MRSALVAAVLVIAAASLLAHDPITTKVTWNREIAPIVQARCVTCHRQGGRAPMSLATYSEARPWARAMREEVLARRMPKWPVVRGYGDFSNDPSLTSFEIALITAWVDGGAPETAPHPATRTTIAALPAGGSAPREDRPVRTVTLPCTSARLPGGELVAVQPILKDGESIRLTLRQPDGAEEPLLWLRDFDPAFNQTYWLRNPIKAPRGTRLQVETESAVPGCALVLSLDL